VDASDDGDPQGLAGHTGRAHHRSRARMPGWIPYLYLGFAAALVPWAVHLAVTLPRRHVSENYWSTWVGFDIALIFVLTRIGWFAYQRNPRVVLTAAAGATMLVADAWFDITTAATGGAQLQAVLSAVVLELPTAALCVGLARRGLAVLTHNVPPPTHDPS
jgi:hypothetical protein